jgi:hypothetical protein
MDRHAYVPYTGVSYMHSQGQPFDRIIRCEKNPHTHRTIIRSPESQTEIDINKKIIDDMMREHHTRDKFPC